MPATLRALLAAFVAACVLRGADAYAPQSRAPLLRPCGSARARGTIVCAVGAGDSKGRSPPPEPDDDAADESAAVPRSELPEGEDVTGASFSTDWDEDWRRFQEEGANTWRPKGRSAYTSQELTAARMRTAVSQTVPEPRQLVRDGRFWLAALVLLALVPTLYTLSQRVSIGDVMV